MRDELRAVLSSDTFGKSPVMSRLLAFLVDATLRGEGDRLKAYSVAVEGLGRQADFDAAADSYPRVQVGRLRKALEAHYAHRPTQEANCLNIPAGGYRVRLSLRRVAYPELLPPLSDAADATFNPPAIARTTVPARQVQNYRRLLLALLALLGTGAALLLGLQTGQVAPSAPKSPQVLLSSVGESANGAIINGHIADGLRRSWVMRVSMGAPEASNPAFHYEIQTQPQAVARGQGELFIRVLDRENGGVIWSVNQQLPAEGEALETTLAPLIARLGSAFGLIARTERARLRGNASPGYACLLLVGEYFRGRDSALKTKVENCIVKDASEPHLAHAVEAARAIVLYAKARPGDRPAALLSSRAMAERSLNRYWESADVLFTNAVLAFYANECVTAATFTDRAITANPYSPNLYGFLGLLTYQCDKTRAKVLLEKARALEPDGPANFRIPLLLLAADGYSGLNVEEIAAEMRMSARSNPLVASLGLALVASVNGDRIAAQRYWEGFRSLSPEGKKTPDEMLRPFILSNALRAAAVRRLEKGGAFAPLP